MSVLEFSVERSGEPGRYDVEIVQSPAGEATATVSIDCDQMMQQRGNWQQALLASASSTRRIVAGPETVLRDVGQNLFEALLGNPGLSARYRSSIDVAAERGEPLRLVLRLSAPELTPLPWEAMFDPQSGAYVSRSEPLVRRVPVASAPHPLRVQHPIRILGITASPSGLPSLDVEAEEQYLSHALEEPLRRGQIELHWARDATWERLQDVLLGGEWHVVHFIGHGDFDVEADEGVLALMGANGRAHHVEASRFADLLHEASPMPRLVVLNSCLSALSGSADLFSGTASALVRSGVSAVVAMQFEITDPAAAAFSRGFYSAIAAGRSVDRAVRSGRVSILGINGHTLEWVTPVLYVRGQETRLFTIEKMAEAAPAPTPAATRSEGTTSHPSTGHHQRNGSHVAPVQDKNELGGRPPSPPRPAPGQQPDPSRPDQPNKRWVKRPVLPWVLLLLLVPVVLLVWVTATRDGPDSSPEIPNVIDQTYQEAAARMESEGLIPVRQDEVAADSAPETVLRTEPGIGTPVSKGSEITLVVAVPDPSGGGPGGDTGGDTGGDNGGDTGDGGGVGPGIVNTPDVVGKPYPEAATLIRDKGLEPLRQDEASTAVVPETVLRTVPGPNEQTTRGSYVTVVVAVQKPEGPVVPDVVGLPYEQADALIRQEKLTPARIEQIDISAPPNTVLRTDPPAGTPIGIGATLNVTVAVSAPGNATPSP